METYFKFIMYVEYIIPLSIFGILIVFMVSRVIIDSIRIRRVNNFFTKNGYMRKLFYVPSVGNGAFYGWVRESDGKRVDDKELKRYSMKQIKEKYK